ncbi:MAG: hypothetical protein ABI557_15165, partial [Aureliella sp.]
MAYSQSESSPSDALDSVAQPQSEQESGSTVPVPLSAGVEEPIEARSAAPSRSDPVSESVTDDIGKKASSTDQNESLVANSSDPTLRQLQSIVIQALGNLDASRLPNRQESNSRLNSAIIQLENYINLNSPNGQAWTQFLKLDELKTELAAEHPQVDKLVELELNMRQNYLGLEQAPYL